jgi:tetratricopeptide (TPR) repeat protein
MRGSLRHGAPAGLSAVLGVGVGLLANILANGASVSATIGFAVSLAVFAAWEVIRARMERMDRKARVENGGGEPPEPSGEMLQMHNLPRPIGGLFVGRDDALSDLEGLLSAGGGVIGQALHGLGGVGKTELALRYAHAQLGDYRLVWWVSAETADLLIDGVAVLAARLGPESVSTSADRYAWAVGWLQSHAGWLLVLDNVEDPKVIEGLLGAVQGRGRVLVTTRRDLTGAVWQRLGLEPLRLGVLDRKASVQLLIGLTGQVGEEDDAEALAAELGDLPLALEQAGAFIAQEGQNIADYRRELARRPGRAYAATAEGFDAQRAVDRVWTVTMDRVKVRAARAEWVTGVLAYLAPKLFPVAVLAGEDGDEVGEAVRVLASYSMLTRTGEMVEVHRLVQAVTRVHDFGQVEHRHAAARLLRQAIPDEPLINVAGWPMWNLLLPHVDALYGETPAEQRSPDLLDTIDQAAIYCQGQGQLNRSIPLFEQVATDRLRVLGADHPGTLYSRNNLARAYEMAGRLGEAIPLFEQAAVDALRVWGGRHPNTLTLRNNLALAYQDAGRLDEAIELFEQVAADCLRVLGADHPQTLALRNNLARAYRTAGRLDEALGLFEQVATGRSRVLGADHPHTLNSLNNLAIAYQMAGRLDEAIELYEQVAADRLRVLGHDHPDTLGSRNSLASAYQDAGRLDEAIELFEQVVADCLRVLGHDHPDTLGSRNNLAGAYRVAGRSGEAVPLFEQAAADCLQVLGADHPNTLLSRNNLASAYQDAGRPDEALGLFEQAAADCLRVLGADHPNTLLSRNNLASAYQMAGRLGQAIPLYEQVAADALRVLGADHPQTVIYLKNLAAARKAAQ